MSRTATDEEAEVARLRGKLMAGLTPIQTYAKAIGKSHRAVQRMIQLKQLDVVKFGKTPYVVVASARKAA